MMSLSLTMHSKKENDVQVEATLRYTEAAGVTLNPTYQILVWVNRAQISGLFNQ